MNRTEHLQWCKDRAMEYVKNGDTREAYFSIISDLGKHPETANHSAIGLGMALLVAGEIDSIVAMERFINDFN